MEKEIEDYARGLLAGKARRLPEDCAALFRRIYAHGHPEWSLDQVVARIPARDLDSAIGLVNRTLREKGIEG